MLPVQPDAVSQGNARLKLLSDIASELLLSTTPHEILSPIFERLSAHLGLEVHINHLVDEGNGHLRLHSSGGISPEQAAELAVFGPGHASYGTDAVAEAPIVVEGIPDSADPHLKVLRSSGITAYLSYPLVAEGRMLGTLSFGTGARSRFESDELELLRTVSNQIAMALERVRLIAELEQRAADQARAVSESEQGSHSSKPCSAACPKGWSSPICGVYR